MSWIISISTIICMELMIRKAWYAWVLTLFNQLLWVFYIYSTKQWGLLLLNAVMTVLAIRGLITWLRDENCSQEQKGEI